MIAPRTPLKLRTALRHALLSIAGPYCRISPGVHLLNGHDISPGGVNHVRELRNMLAMLSQEARLLRVQDAVQLIRSRAQVSEPCIAFTFDDGFDEVYQLIAPELDRVNVNAALFINPGFCRGDAAYREWFTRQRLGQTVSHRPLSPRSILELAVAGYEIGAHTLDHVLLQQLDADELRRQVVDCKVEVERLSHKTCRWFAWTYGKYQHISQEALQLARQQYEIVFGSDRYRYYGNADLSVIHRRHVECYWPPSHLKFLLSGTRRYPCLPPGHACRPHSQEENHGECIGAYPDSQ
jgi:peptidoglycan/xylan/chitin deacetylase (PgdA/CDA1 family)